MMRLVLATRFVDQKLWEHPKTMQSKITKIATKIVKMKKLGSKREKTQEQNHSYITIIEVTYKAREL